MPSDHLVLCHPLLLLPSILPSIRVFSNESALCIRWPKYWSFSFSISPSYEYSGLISFRIDWFDLLAVQGTLKSLLQHHSSKTSILQPSAFFGVQLSHPYTTTKTTTALTRQTFVGKVMSLLFNVLSGYPTGLTGACCRLRGTGSSSPGRHSKHTGISPLGGGCHYPYHRAYRFSSVQLSRSVMSDSLQPHEPHHTRLPYPSLPPGVCSNSCPWSQWCHPTTSSSVVPFSSCLQSFPASGSFPMSQPFPSGGQSIGVSIQHQSFLWVFRTDFL